VEADHRCGPCPRRADRHPAVAHGPSGAP
jgi:hypothetical protein